MFGSRSVIILSVTALICLSILATSPSELLEYMGENISNLSYFKSLVIEYVDGGRGGDEKKVEDIVNAAIKRIDFLQRSLSTLESAKEMLIYTILLKGKEDVRFEPLGRKIEEKLELLPLRRDRRLTSLIDGVIEENLTLFLSHLGQKLPLTREQVDVILKLLDPQIESVVTDIKWRLRHKDYKRSLEKAESLEPIFSYSRSLKDRISNMMNVDEVWLYAGMNDVDVKKFLALYNAAIIERRMNFLLSLLREGLSKYDYNTIFHISTFGKGILEAEGLKEELSNVYRRFNEYNELYSLAKEIVSMTVRIRQTKEATPLKNMFISIVDMGKKIEESTLTARLNENLKGAIGVYKDVILTMDPDKQKKIRNFLKSELSKEKITNDVIKDGVKDILSVSPPSPTGVIHHPHASKGYNTFVMTLWFSLILISLFLILWSAIPTYRWARLFGKMGLYSLSIYLYHKLLSKAPASVEVHLGLAEVLERAGRRAEAQKEYNLALKLISPKDEHEKQE